MPDIDDDPRTYFAEERTFLAWIRTGLGLMGVGFAVARFGLFLRQFQEQQVLVFHSSAQTIVHSTGASVYGGVALVALGTIVNVGSIARHVHVTPRTQVPHLDLRAAFMGRHPSRPDPFHLRRRHRRLSTSLTLTNPKSSRILSVVLVPLEGKRKGATAKDRSSPKVTKSRASPANSLGVLVSLHPVYLDIEIKRPRRTPGLFYMRKKKTAKPFGCTNLAITPLE